MPILLSDLYSSDLEILLESTSCLLLSGALEQFILHSKCRIYSSLHHCHYRWYFRASHSLLLRILARMKEWQILYPDL